MSSRLRKWPLARPSAVAVSEDAGTLEDVYEPYLIQQGFLERTPRGRVATALAYQRFGITPPPGTQRTIFERDA